MSSFPSSQAVPSSSSSSDAAVLSSFAPAVVRKPVARVAVEPVEPMTYRPPASQPTRGQLQIAAPGSSPSPAVARTGRWQNLYRMTGENWKVSGLVGTASVITGIALLATAPRQYNKATRGFENFAGSVLLLGGVGIDAISAFGPKKADSTGAVRYPLHGVPKALGEVCVDCCVCLSHPCVFWPMLVGEAIGGGVLLALGVGNLNDDSDSYDGYEGSSASNKAPGYIAGGAILATMALAMFTFALCTRPSGGRQASSHDPEREREDRDWNQAVALQISNQNNYQNMVNQGNSN